MRRNILLFIAALLPMMSSAYQAKIDGIYYNFSEDEAEVTYQEFDGLYGPISDYSGSVVISESVSYYGKTYSVTSIGDYAFERCSGLTSVTIPNSVTSIGNYAFERCSGLTSVTIPNSVTSIGNSAFSWCSGLTSITIPNSVTSIGGSAFSGCYFIRENFVNNSASINWNNWGATLYDGVETSDGLIITDNVVVKCRPWVKDVTIPNSVTSIGNYAFSECSSLTSVTIPNNVTNIGDYAFERCSGLISVTIPNSVTSIGEYTFSRCSGLTSVAIGNSVTSIGQYAFYDCWRLTSVTIPNSVTSIGEYTFSWCSGLTSVTIGSSVTSIGNSAFRACSGLTSVTIPNSVTSIGQSTFYGCSGLTSITIGSSVSSIGYWVFIGCSSLTSIKVETGNTKFDSRNNCNAIIETATNTLIIGCMNTLIPNSVTSIGYEAFYGCSGLTSITIPNSVTSIGGSAFSGCSGLSSVTIGNSVKSIGPDAFGGCSVPNILIKGTTPPSISNNSFSEPTFYHAILFVPIDSWYSYAFKSDWYRFINIRETATTEEQVSMQQAYTLMDARTFAYSIYDPVNDCIGTINSFSSINEDNPYHSWQVIQAGGRQYLYNVGAKKFVVSSSDGSFTLSETPTSIEMENGNNGIILGSQTARQWALVSNNHLTAEQAVITGIDDIQTTTMESGTVYDLNGRRFDKTQRGLNIIRYSDGTSRNVLVK